MTLRELLDGYTGEAEIILPFIFVEGDKDFVITSTPDAFWSALGSTIEDCIPATEMEKIAVENGVLKAWAKMEPTPPKNSEYCTEGDSAEQPYLQSNVLADMPIDALNYIKQLEAEIAQLKEEKHYGR